MNDRRNDARACTRRLFRARLRLRRTGVRRFRGGTRRCAPGGIALARLRRGSARISPRGRRPACVQQPKRRPDVQPWRFAESYANGPTPKIPAHASRYDRLSAQCHAIARQRRLKSAVRQKRHPSANRDKARKRVSAFAAEKTSAAQQPHAHAPNRFGASRKIARGRYPCR